MHHTKRWFLPLLVVFSLLLASCGPPVTNPNTTPLVVTTAIQVTPPASPTGLIARVKDYNVIELSWNDNSQNDDSFRMEQSTDPTFSRDVNSIPISPNTTYFSVYAANAVPTAFLNPVTTYYFRIFAVNLSVESQPSNIATDWYNFYAFQGTQAIYNRHLSLATTPTAMNYVATFWRGMNWYDINGDNNQGTLDLGWQYVHVCTEWQSANWIFYPDGRVIPGVNGLRFEAEIAKLNRGEILPYVWQGATQSK